MANGRWMNPGLPQTLQGAIIFSYINAVFALFALVGGSSLALVLVAGGVGAYGIANERRWGYWLCLSVAVIFLLLRLLQLLFFSSPFVFAELFNLIFSVALVAFLLHPTSRSYQRIYFH